VGFDTSFIHGSFASRGAIVPWALGGEALNGARIKETVLEGGRECFEIVATYPRNLSASIANVLPPTLKKNASAVIPTEGRAIIDRNTFEPIELALLSLDGSTISKLEIRDIERPTELADDLFLPADGIELRNPPSFPEYFDILGSALKIRPQQLARSEDHRPALDPLTGRLLPPLPLGASRDEFERRIASRSKHRPAARSSKGSVEPVIYTSSSVVGSSAVGEDAALSDDLQMLNETPAAGSNFTFRTSWAVGALTALSLTVVFGFVRRRLWKRSVPPRPNARRVPSRLPTRQNSSTMKGGHQGRGA
jgi:hypothetical protein